MTSRPTEAESEPGLVGLYGDAVDTSLATVWEHVARRLPDAVAISVPGRDVTYAEFDDRAARLASGLEAAGVRAGDPVACYLYNGAAYLETVFAAFKLGALPVNVNYRYTGSELGSLLADAGAAAIVFSGSLAAHLGQAVRQVSSLRLLVRAGAAPADVDAPEAVELDELMARCTPRAPEERPGSDRLLMYTGGTTGLPKGVVWRHSDLLNALSVPITRPLGVTSLPQTAEAIAELAVSAHRDGRSPVVMPVVPLMHATGLFNTMGPLMVGGRAVIARPGRLDPRHVWDMVAEQRVGTLIVAGNAVCHPLLEELRSAEARGEPHDLGPLRQILSSGTALSDDVKRELHSRAEVTIIDAVASSEGGPVAFAETRAVGDLPSRFFPLRTTKVLNAQGREVTPGSGEIGLLASSAPMPVGYHKDEARTAETFRTIDGVRYAIPGDFATVETDGAVRFLGRGSGVINTGGEKVYPNEVESVLLTHPDVADAVVVGVPDEVWGERVAAVVALTERGTVDEAGLRAWARQSLAGYKVPRVIVVRRRLERTPTGKLETAWARRTVEQALAAGTPAHPAGDAT